MMSPPLRACGFITALVATVLLTTCDDAGAMFSRVLRPSSMQRTSSSMLRTSSVLPSTLGTSTFGTPPHTFGTSSPFGIGGPKTSSTSLVPPTTLFTPTMHSSRSFSTKMPTEKESRWKGVMRKHGLGVATDFSTGLLDHPIVHSSEKFGTGVGVLLNIHAGRRRAAMCAGLTKTARRVSAEIAEQDPPNAAQINTAIFEIEIWAMKLVGGDITATGTSITVGAITGILTGPVSFVVSFAIGQTCNVFLKKINAIVSERAGLTVESVREPVGVLHAFRSVNAEAAATLSVISGLSKEDVIASSLEEVLAAIKKYVA